MKPTELINLFLDTTPRQWGRFIGRLLIAPFQFGFHEALWIVLSVGFHALIATAIVASPMFIDMNHSVATEKGATYQIEVSLTTTPDVQPVYDPTSGIIMPVVHPPKHLTEAERLFEKYRNLHLKKRSVDLKTPQTSWIARRAPQPQLQHLAAMDLRHQLANQPATPLKMIDSKDEMIQYLAQYQRQFQTCYDTALLKDESLKGKVQFLLSTGSQGQVTESEVHFQGAGLAETRAQLEQCLQRLTQRIRFPSSLKTAADRSIQFQAVLTL